MKRKVCRFRRGLSLALCLALLLPLFGCGKEAPAELSSEPGAETEATEAAQQVRTDPVEAALTAAQADLDRADYDSAAEILEQALEDSTDPRLTLLAEQAEAETALPALDTQKALAVDTSAVRALNTARTPVMPKAKDGVQPYGDYWWDALPEDADLSDAPELAYSLCFSDHTVFPDKMPSSFDPAALLEWGKDPGLNVDVLHALGYSGKGAMVAYVDQPLNSHEAYANAALHYTNSWATTISA